MVRKSVGFVSKRAHRKSRSGCLICKRKKVKCDEAQPSCGYCSLRKLDCQYPVDNVSDSPVTSNSSLHHPSPGTCHDSPELDFNDSDLLVWLVPATHTAGGHLTFEDLELLHHYKTSTWQKFMLREDPTVESLQRDVIPSLSISANYLLYAILSVAATHQNTLRPSPEKEHKALLYRQKTFQEYTKALQHITSDNYETILVTGTFLLSLMPAPAKHAADGEHLEWMHSLLKLTEGLRILASLHWAHGIEKMTIYPLVRRELRTLPPPPVIKVKSKSHLQGTSGPLGTTPDHPNPPPTYDLPFPMTFANMVFLPPPLSKLLENMVQPRVSNFADVHRDALIPAFHALSPIFLSLYYYHLNADFFVRIFVFSSFLMPDFLALVKARESRALVVIAWWFAMAGLVPRGWWVGDCVISVVEAAGRVIRTTGDEAAAEATRGAEKLVFFFERYGREEAAKSIFDGWEGVTWADGPRRAEEWERSLSADLNLRLDSLVLTLDEEPLDLNSTPPMQDIMA